MMSAWHFILIGEIVVDVLLGWHFFLWRQRRLCFVPTLMRWAFVDWSVLLLMGGVVQSACLSNVWFWLTTGLIAWFSGPVLALWWLYGAHRWRPEGMIAQIYHKFFGECK